MYTYDSLFKAESSLNINDLVIKRSMQLYLMCICTLRSNKLLSKFSRLFTGRLMVKLAHIENIETTY